MRFMIVHKSDTYYDKSNPPPAEFMAKMDGLLTEMNNAGVLLAGEGLRHPKHGVKVVYKDGGRTVTDGPYAEAKEVIAGFVMLDVRSMDEALEWSHRFGACFDEIEVEVRPVTEASDFA